MECRVKLDINIDISFCLCFTERVVQGNADESEGGDWISDDLEEDDFPKSENNTTHLETGEVLEPYVGMEFDSEEDARRFYNNYAKRVGFVASTMQHRRFEADGTSLALRIGCYKKQGSLSPKTKAKDEQENKARTNAHEVCKAMILFKLKEKSGKWVVTRFVKDHNHPLVVDGHDKDNENVHEKKKKIAELTRELQRQEEIYAAYRESLINLLANVEEKADRLSSKVLAVVQNVRKAETEQLIYSRS